VSRREKAKVIRYCILKRGGGRPVLEKGLAGRAQMLRGETPLANKRVPVVGKSTGEEKGVLTRRFPEG